MLKRSAEKMNHLRRTKIVCGLLGVEQFWGARIGHELQLAAVSHGGGAEEDFKEVVKVVGSSWVELGVSKEPQLVIEKQGFVSSRADEKICILPEVASWRDWHVYGLCRIDDRRGR